jgi:hypothetical protein
MGIRSVVLGIGALIFVFAGLQMISLHSQGGNSVAEFFYQAMGLFSFGMAFLTAGAAIPANPPRTADRHRIGMQPVEPPK